MVVLLVFGMWARWKAYFLERFAIPAPVIGGFAFVLVNLALRQSGLLELTFDTTLQSFFMVIFFTFVGYDASWGAQGRWSEGDDLSRAWHRAVLLQGSRARAVRPARGAGKGLAPAVGTLFDRNDQLVTFCFIRRFVCALRCGLDGAAGCAPGLPGAVGYGFAGF